MLLQDAVKVRNWPHPWGKTTAAQGKFSRSEVILTWRKLCAPKGRVGRESVANADNFDASVLGLVFSIEVNDHAG